MSVVVSLVVLIVVGLVRGAPLDHDEHRQSASCSSSPRSQEVALP